MHMVDWGGFDRGAGNFQRFFRRGKKKRRRTIFPRFFRCIFLIRIFQDRFVFSGKKEKSWGMMDICCPEEG